MFCSRQCSHDYKRRDECVCANPACGKPFWPRRVSDEHGWRGVNKYCSRDCYCDHRFGVDRPRQRRTKAVVDAASKYALATSLRKKCKVLGVTFDPACTRKAVLDRDGWVCQFCRIKCNKDYRLDPITRASHPANAEHDHIIALTIKGSPGNVFTNSQCLCSACNRKKGAAAAGQLRLPLEEEAWGKGVRVRSPRHSKSFVATQASGA